METATAWREATNPAKQRALCAAGLAVGGVLSYGLRPGGAASGRDAQAGFLLGLLLAVLFGAGLLVGGGSSVEVDPGRRRIVVERRTVRGTRQVLLPFDDIESMNVSTVAGHHGDTPAWYVAAKRRSGGELALYLGFFDGQFSRAAMESRRLRIERVLDR